jgi:DNA-binding NtrC family response regulator
VCGVFDGSARVLVVSRRRRFRAAFAALLAREGWGAIAATATSIEEAAGIVDGGSVDVVALDSWLLGEDWLGAVSLGRPDEDVAVLTVAMGDQERLLADGAEDPRRREPDQSRPD